MNKSPHTYAVFGILQAQTRECGSGALTPSRVASRPKEARMRRKPIPTLTPEQIDRFWSRVDQSGGPNACWPWRLACGSYGYGRVSLFSSDYIAHVVAYTITYGQVPIGLQLDHVRARGCTRRDCCNPAHLEPVTQLENARRGIWATKTHCKRGHEFTVHNAMTRAGRPGQRDCRACHYDRIRRRHAKQATL